MLVTVMAALAQMEHGIKRERVTESISKRREAGKDLGGRPRRVTASQIRSTVRLVKGGEPAAQVCPRDTGMSEQPSIGGHENLRTSRATFGAARRPPFTAVIHTGSSATFLVPINVSHMRVLNKTLFRL